MTNYIRRKQLEITPENYEEYGVLDEELTNELGIPWYEFNIADIGTNLVYRDNWQTGNIFPTSEEAFFYTYLPGTGMEDLSISRQYVGSRCCISNYSSKDIGITGRIMLKETYEESAGSGTFNSITVSSNTFCELECVHEVDAQGFETVFWVIVSRGLLLDATR